MSAAADAAPDVKPALSAAADAVVKPELDSAFINLIVKQQNGAVTHFRMKRDAPFKKVNHRTQSAFSYPPPPPPPQLMDTFCSRQSLDVRTVKFLWDGHSLRPDSTPTELGTCFLGASAKRS